MSRQTLVDAHLDLAYNALLGYDVRLPLNELRATPVGLDLAARRQTPTVSLPALKAGHVAVVFGTIFVLPADAPGDLRGEGYTTAEQAHAAGAQQLAFYRELQNDRLARLIANSSDLQALLAGRERDAAAAPLGIVPLMEGADPIRQPSELPWWVAQGVRIVGPAWSATRYSGGTARPGPLTADGRTLMAEMNSAPVALDASHMAEESFWQALDLFHGPLIASHSNCRRFVPTDRHLSDDMIRAIVERDGVIGVVIYNRFLDAGWTDGAPKDAVRLEAVVRHIEHICELAGDTGHAAIGTDLDGGYGIEQTPNDLDTIADVQKIPDLLRKRGYGEEDVAAVMHGNWLRLLERGLPNG